jgi:putative ABC transport system ATP-binding protein
MLSSRVCFPVWRLLVGELLSLRGVSKSFVRGGRPLHVLEEVSLEVAPGEIVAVEGPRYSGKTTLLCVAAGIVRPDRGEVWFGGRELAGLSNVRRDRLRGREIRWTDREGPGTKLKVRDAIALPLRLGRGKRNTKVIAEEALARVGVPDCAGQRWEDLSHCEAVFAGLARGIAGCPRLLVMDDLFDALGSKRTQEFGDLLRSLVGELGCGVLMSASDPSTAAVVADRVWSLARGALTLTSDQTGVTDAQIIDFPDAARRGVGSRGVGP